MTCGSWNASTERTCTVRTRLSAYMSMLTGRVDDAFCIGHEGGVATINGLRLGRLPDVPASARVSLR